PWIHRTPHSGKRFGLGAFRSRCGHPWHLKSMRSLTMARKSALILAAVLAAAVSPVAAQAPTQPRAGQAGRSPVVMLARQQSVQEELKLTQGQINKVAEIVKALREKVEDITEADPPARMKKAMEIFAGAEKDIFALLQPAQAKRLRQIALQQQPLAQALTRPEVAKELQLSKEQAKRVRAIRERATREVSKLSEGTASRKELREKRSEYAKAMQEKLLEVLTERQKARWRELLGKPFKGELERGLGPRPPGEKG